MASFVRAVMSRRWCREHATWLQGLRAARNASGPSATFSATVIESKSSMRWNVRPSPWEIAVAEPDAPGVTRHHTGARVEDRRLPCAVRSDEPGDGTGGGMERHPADRDESTELDSQAVHVEVGLHFDHGSDP
jgi:hypothetical protein